VRLEAAAGTVVLEHITTRPYEATLEILEAADGVQVSGGGPTAREQQVGWARPRGVEATRGWPNGRAGLYGEQAT
jgi:hypothetical protein